MNHSRPKSSLLAWTLPGRLIAFMLAAASIWCLLADFYGLCPMKTFTIYVFVPATLVLVLMAVFDRVSGDGRLFRAVMIGGVAGLVAAIAYDMFRLPFVFARPLRIDAIVPPLNLFKVFPRFGAMIMGQPIEQPAYSLPAHLIGWTYHFSNGVTFGIMYTALVGDASRRHWQWAIAFAVGVELAMLYSPYARVFSIPLTGTFVPVTLVAHAIFGIAMGLTARRVSLAWPATSRSAPS